MKASVNKVASMYIAAAMPNPLDGMSRRQATRMANMLINRAKLGGMFRDSYWQPVNRLWKTFSDAGVQYNMESNRYITDPNGSPIAKEWKFTIGWDDQSGRPQIAWGVVTASGAGPVGDIMDMYDVTAYVS